MWALLNQTSASLPVEDTPEPIVLQPNSITNISPIWVMRSPTLGNNIASLGLCIVNFESFIGGLDWAPITYPVHPLSQELVTNYSQGITIGPFSDGVMVINVTGLGGPLTLNWALFDGVQMFPVETLWSTAIPGTFVVPFSEVGSAGAIQWVINTNATFSILLHLR